MPKRLFFKIALILVLFIGVFLLIFFRFTFTSLISYNPNLKIKQSRIEGYTDKFSYRNGDTIKLQIHAESNGLAIISRSMGNYEYKKISEFNVCLFRQSNSNIDQNLSCNWKSNYIIVVDSCYSPGIYKIDLVSNSDTGYITFLVENRPQKTNIVLLLPTSTWIAYNTWGGKSLYKNKYENKTVYRISNQRPNIEFNFADSLNGIHTDILLTNYFISNYNAMVLPDYALENEAFEGINIIVLAHHCEYFSEKMYDNLIRQVSTHKKSLISLGANQIYWKIKWDDDIRVMECRKDRSFFSFLKLDYGGRWRDHLFRSEHNLFGVRYSESGAGTYAPYKVKNAEHWIFKGSGITNGSFFGYNGINSRALSGLETDKRVHSKDALILAKGHNQLGIEDTLQSGAGGAEFVIIEKSDSQAILSTGSIQSAAGLGYDSTFTIMLRNFINRYKE
jgi:hypothetical protein